MLGVTARVSLGRSWPGVFVAESSNELLDEGLGGSPVTYVDDPLRQGFAKLRWLCNLHRRPGKSTATGRGA